MVMEPSRTPQRRLWHDDLRWSTGCAFVDYDRDGRLDLFISQFIDFDPAKTHIPGQIGLCRWKGIPVMCTDERKVRRRENVEPYRGGCLVRRLSVHDCCNQARALIKLAGGSGIQSLAGRVSCSVKFC
jgi:hypothetical protein